MDPAGLETPTPIGKVRHEKTSFELFSDPSGGQTPKAYGSSSYHDVLRGSEARFDSPAACASKGVTRGHVDLPFRSCICLRARMRERG